MLDNNEVAPENQDALALHNVSRALFNALIIIMGETEFDPDDLTITMDATDGKAREFTLTAVMGSCLRVLDDFAKKNDLPSMRIEYNGETLGRDEF